MFGINELRLNAATMAEIVQYYLDNKLFNAYERSPKVSVVEFNSASVVFVVTLTTEAPKGT